MRSTTVTIFLINLQFIFCIVPLHLSDYFAHPVLEDYLRTIVSIVSSDKWTLYIENFRENSTTEDREGCHRRSKIVTKEILEWSDRRIYKELLYYPFGDYLDALSTGL